MEIKTLGCYGRNSKRHYKEKGIGSYERTERGI
jgi:hypothetical protein